MKEPLYIEGDLVYYIEQEGFNGYEEGYKAFNTQLLILKKLTKKYAGKGFAIGLAMGNGYMVKIRTLYVLDDGSKEVGTIERRIYRDLSAETNIHMYVYGDTSDIIAQEFEKKMNRQYNRYSYQDERFKVVYHQTQHELELSNYSHLDVMWPHTKAIYTTWKKYVSESKEIIQNMNDEHEFIQTKSTTLRLIKNEDEQ